ncbi:MAG: stage II sporulation protein M [Candidatus Bathyarchaeota archaeon]|nr:stage II sporulation protein M [Candidatus Bathyarchaeota archaeon]
MVLDVWRNASSKRKRVYTVVAVFVFSIIITLVGTLMPVDAEQARQINDRLNQTLTAATESEMLMQYIFGNNFFICLIMFIPIVGPIFGFSVLFSTGVATSAIAVAQGFPSILAVVALVITPVFWLEYAAYSTAMAMSFWLFRRILQGRGGDEFRNTCLFITLCAALLAVGAAVETVLITLAV